MRRWAAASLLVVAALYGHGTEQRAVAAAVAAVIVGALALGPRVALSARGARVAAVVGAAAGAALGWAVVPELGAPLRPPWPSFALAGLLAGAALLCRKDTSTDAGLSLLPGLAALTACGEAPLGIRYGVVAALHLALALLALHEGRAGAADATPAPDPADPAGHASRAVSRRRAAALALLLGLAAAVTAGFVVGLPPLSLWSQGRILRALGSAESGFSDRMWLGSLDGLLQSDEVVMRVEGAPTDYLRGAVYDHYEEGRWGRLHAGRPVPMRLDAHPDPGGQRARISVVAGARDRFFVPLGARDIAAVDADVAVDRFGVVRIPVGTAREVSFASGGAPEIAVDGPGDDDLVLPASLRRPLQRIAAEWTAGAATPEQKVDAIAERLRTRFAYSLEFARGRRRDPLLDFLLDDQRGHCEYFASALTLLARAAGVPARVAVGYRVAERNTLGGYWVVRERNAHAWSEVYLPGRGFVTVDATPSGAVAANTPHGAGLAGALWDLAGAAWGRAAARITLLHVAGALLGVVVVGLVLRAIRGRRGPTAARAKNAALTPAPRPLVRLLDALARRGVVRSPSEPLERFAGRLAGPELAPAAELLGRWAAYRYGGIGEAEGLMREMEGCAERLRRGRVRN